MLHWDIVVAFDVIPAEKYAAEEFRRLFLQATGSHLPICYYAEKPILPVNKTPHLYHVFIGDSQALRESGLNIDTRGVGAGEEWLKVVVNPDYIVIVGGKPRGVLYGVYQFMEDKLGIRFLTYDHTHVPGGKNKKIACGELAYEPPFSFRCCDYQENEEHPEFATRLRLNTFTSEQRLGGRTGQIVINHTFPDIADYIRDKFKPATPPDDYFALVDPGQTKRNKYQLCVTNLNVVQWTVEWVLDQLKKQPDVKNVSISQGDTSEWCRCPTCLALNVGCPMRSHLAFVNTVAETVAQTRPKIEIGTLAYWYSRRPPKDVPVLPPKAGTVPLHSNVQIWYTGLGEDPGAPTTSINRDCCALHAIDDYSCGQNEAFRKDMAGWMAICNNIWVWSYIVDFGYFDLPFPNLRSIGPNIRYFLKNGVKGVYMMADYCSLAGELSDLRNYLTSRLLWNPGLDDEEVIKEFVALHYQSASQPILDYIAKVHDDAELRAKQTPATHPTQYAPPKDLGFEAYDTALAKTIFGYFESALKAATNAAIRSRVEKASICAYRAMLVSKAWQSPAERADLIAGYQMLCKRYGVCYVGESEPAKDYIKQLLAQP